MTCLTCGLPMLPGHVDGVAVVSCLQGHTLAHQTAADTPEAAAAVIAWAVELPLPPKPCSCNWRGHWGTRSKHIKAYRRECYDRFHAAMLHGTLPVQFKGPVTVHLDYYLCNNGPNKDVTYSKLHNVVMPRDQDNARFCFKAGQDAMKDIGLVPDDGTAHVWVGETRIHAKAKEHGGRSCVVVTFEAADQWPKVTLWR